MSYPSVAKERTGWRDEAISLRHREWGWNCPTADLDFVLCEYNRALPVAIVEYKERHAEKPDFKTATYRALKSLADLYSPGSLPFFVATYDQHDFWFVVTCVNDAARYFFRGCEGLVLTEQRYVRGLYLMRKICLSEKDEEIISKLKTIIPE